MKTKIGFNNLISTALIALAGCANNHFALPMTASQLTDYNKGAALAEYLSQPGASAEVCDQHASIPHIKVVDPETRKSLDEGFRNGRIPPETWNVCMVSLLRDASPDVSQDLMEVVSHDALATLEEKRLETDALQRARLESIWQLYTERDFNQSSRPAARKDLFSGLQRDVSKNRLGPFGLSHAKDLLDIFELEQGRWHATPVDLASLDHFLKQGDEKTLRLFMLHLPDETLRSTAQRYVIRLHIQASPFQEVHSASSDVEDAMMRTGTNPVSLSCHPVVRGLWKGAQAPVRHVVVEQNVIRQTARLLGYAVEGSTLTVLPSIPLRDFFQVELKGISKPVTVCSAGKDLDVSPCLKPGDVSVRSANATLDSPGIHHLRDAIDASAAAEMAQSGPELVLPLWVANRQVAALQWPISFKTSEDLVFTGQGAGSPGPDLKVRVDLTQSAFLIYRISSLGLEPLWAVAERSLAADFHIISQGAAGHAGTNGSDGLAGSDGISGSDASCPSFSGNSGSNGSDGSSGGEGSSGGTGGDGGNITLTITGSSSARAQTYPLLSKIVLSRGGEGGSGGSGGNGGGGGHGGRGGSGTLCWTTDENGNTSASSMLSGGSNGADGTKGSDGSDGLSGLPGNAGRISFLDES